MMTAATDSGAPSPPASKSRERKLKRPESFNTEKLEMSRRLQAIQQPHLPKAIWFLAGILVMFGLYLYNALFSR
jgi:hypothetical protein